MTVLAKKTAHLGKEEEDRATHFESFAVVGLPDQYLL